jgi:hypothetical protein
MPPKVWHAVNATALVCLIGWVGYDALGTNVFGERAWPEGMVDFHILCDQSTYFVTHKAYVPGGVDYAYPPCAAILHYVVAALPRRIAAAVWLSGTLAATGIIWWILVRMLDLTRLPGWAAVVLVGYIPAAYFTQWDLRSQNCNLFFLATLLCGLYALDRRRPAKAGFWIALSFSLKLFSLLVIPYLLWTGRRRAFAWTLTFLTAFWLCLPGAVLGRQSCLDAYAEWFSRIQRSASYPMDVPHPILISLQRSAAWLAADDARLGALIFNAIRGAWLAIGIAAAAAARRRRASNPASLLADAGVLVLSPVAVSPYLEPYHAVAFVIPALLLVCAAADSNESKRLRWLAALLCVSMTAVLSIPQEWELRGLGVNARLFLGVAGAAFVGGRSRFASARRSAPESWRSVTSSKADAAAADASSTEVRRETAA